MRARNSIGEFPRQSQNSEIVFWESNDELIVALDLLAHGNLFFDQRQAELPAEKPIGLFPVIELIVVRARVAVFVPLENILFPIKLEEGFHAVIDERLYQRRTKTAVVFGVIDQQGRPWSHHRSKVRIVQAREKVGPVLFDISQVSIFPRFHLCGHRRIAGHRNGCFHTLVQRTQKNGLPSAPGEAGDAQATAIHVGVVVEIIEPASHFEQEDSQPVCAHQVEMRAVPMLITILAKLSEEKPFQVERQNPVLCEVDASLLLVLNSLSRRADVTVHVEDRWHFPPQLFRLIKNRNGLKAGHNLIAKLSQPVTLACFDHSDVFKPRRSVDPFIGPSVKHHVLEQMLPQAFLLLRPLRRIRYCRRRSNAAENVRLDLMHSDTGC